MKYTIKDFAALTNKTESAMLDKANQLFEGSWSMGYEEVAQPILNDDLVVIDMKMTHAFGVAVVAALDAEDKTDDVIFVLVENELTFYLNPPHNTNI